MPDTANLLYYVENGNAALRDKDYLGAAIYFWEAIQCGEHGDFYGGVQTAMEAAKNAKCSFDNIRKKHFPPIALSKSAYIMGCQCVKQMWLNKYEYDCRQISKETQAKFDRGHTIGALAQQLFPNGIDASSDSASHFRDRLQAKSPLLVPNLPFFLKSRTWAKKTTNLISGNERYIYEAAFINDSVFAAIDILSCDNGRNIAYEVKSSEAISDVYLDDCALQYYVINHNLRLSDFCIVYLNEEYLSTIGIEAANLTMENCDINKLFIVKSVMPEIEARQDEVIKNIRKFKAILKDRYSEPKINVGAQCDDPYECPFKQYCNRRDYDFNIW